MGIDNYTFEKNREPRNNSLKDVDFSNSILIDNKYLYSIQN